VNACSAHRRRRRPSFQHLPKLRPSRSPLLPNDLLRRSPHRPRRSPSLPHHSPRLPHRLPCLRNLRSACLLRSRSRHLR